MGTIRIMSRFGNLLREVEADSLRLALEEAVRDGANLYGANLYGADITGANLYGANLYGADLTGANLYGADLTGANLYGADLTGAYLTRANFYGADLIGADLIGAEINWQSHALLAELLLRAADEDVEKRKVAGLIAVSTDWCWDRFEELGSDPLFPWAVGVLAAYILPEDDAPDIVREYADRANEQAEAQPA